MFFSKILKTLANIVIDFGSYLEKKKTVKTSVHVFTCELSNILLDNFNSEPPKCSSVRSAGIYFLPYSMHGM